MKGRQEQGCGHMYWCDSIVYDMVLNWDRQDISDAMRGSGIAAHGDGAVVLAKAGPAHVALHIFRKEEKWIVATFHLKVQKRKIRREEKFENKESNV